MHAWLHAQLLLPKAIIIARVIGATISSSHLPSLLWDICKHICQAYNVSADTIPSGAPQVLSSWHLFLNNATPQQ